MSVQLRLLVRDSKVQPSHAVGEAFDLAKHDCVGFIGPASSGSTELVSRFLALEAIDRAVISYSATSAELSESRFSNFLRTPPTDDYQAKLMAKLIGLLVKACLGRVHNEFVPYGFISQVK